ncbi:MULTISPECIES: CvpA family protein [unclassified Thioalkalivibrio]|uniref:CvpA family protein n=1 Tax=unclassified Thioalkalivibrio TaxID=2621013 RepID=UPI000371EE90|nr:MULTISPECIES: CvpA family protein [unclassified Thioalkalivibrio]
MNWIDLVIVALIAVSGVISLFRGFVRETFSLATWIVGIWVGIRFAADVAVVLPDAIPDETIRLAIGFAVLFIAVLIVGGLLGVLAGKLVKGTGLTGTDRALGVIFGALRGVVLVAMLVFLASLTLMPEEGWWERSMLIPHFERVVDWMLGLLPEDWQEQLEGLLSGGETDAGAGGEASFPFESGAEPDAEPPDAPQ